MTMIVPAGNNKLDWSPKGSKLQKTASDGQEVKDIEVDALYEAAKGIVEAEASDECCGECGNDPCKCKKDRDEECEEKKEDVKEAAESCGEMLDEEAIVLDVEEVSDEVEEVEEADAQSVSEAVAEVEQKAEEAEAVVQEVAQAVEQIEEAVESVKEVCNGGEAEEEAEEAEDIPGEEVVDSEVIVEGEETCASTEAPAMDKSASAEEFCKYAKLSPQNRKKLNDYWTNMLGYPKDFVNLMTKDYEK